jgi:ATP phosphoribosyltransferase
MELIADISSWVIVNKASMKMKRARIKEVIQQLSQVVKPG